MSWLTSSLPGAAAALAAYLFLRGYRLLRTDGAENLDLTDLESLGGAQKPRARTRGPLTALSYRLAPTLRRALPPRAIAWLRGQINQAGRPEGLDIDSVLARAVTWMILVAPVAVLLGIQGQVIPLLMAGGVVVIMPLARLSSLASTRREQIDRDLPDFLDVLAVTVSAGIGFRQALGTVAERFGGPVGDEVIGTLHQIANGATVRAAFRSLRARNSSESMEEFTTAYLQAEELGAPLVDTLNQIASDMRRSAAQRHRQRAARLAPRVTLLTTLVMVPGAMILLVAGIYVGSGFTFSSLGGF